MLYQKRALRSLAVALLALLPISVPAADLAIKTGSDYIAPQTVPGATTVDTTKAHALWKERAWFVDPRSNSDWQAGRIPGAVHVQYDPGKPNQELTEASLAQQVGKSEPVVFYCNGEGCDRSAWAAALANEWGWSDVYYYRDGFPAWKAAGNPVE